MADKRINDGGPAFPVPSECDGIQDEKTGWNPYHGMTLRQYGTRLRRCKDWHSR